MQSCLLWRDRHLLMLLRPEDANAEFRELVSRMKNRSEALTDAVRDLSADFDKRLLEVERRRLLALRTTRMSIIASMQECERERKRPRR